MQAPKGVPMYLKVAETVRERINSYAYKFGERIPAARDLALEFGVSAITIRKAVERLTQEGYLATRQGSGTTVVFPGREKFEIRMSGNFRQWLDSASGKRPKLEIEILDLSSSMAPPAIQTQLGLPPDAPAGQLRRIRRHQGQIVSYYLNFFNARHLEKLPREKLLARSFIEVFQEATAIGLKKMEQQVEAITADIDLAALLDTHYGEPLFFIKNVYYAAQNRPVVVSHMYYRGDRYIYKASFPL